MIARIFSPWLKRSALAAALVAPLAAGALCSTAQAQSVFTPLSTFGSNGWLAPASLPFLKTDNNQRGLGVNPTTGAVIVTDRDATLGNNVYVLNGTSGAVSGTLTPPAGGYSGGTFLISAVGVGSDGAAYVGNLATTAASAFKVYKWVDTSDFATPATVAYSGTFTGGAPRFGDSFAVYGSGTSTIFAAAGSNSTVANVNSYFAVGSLDGLNTRTAFTQVINSSTSTAGNNGYRLGLSFTSGTSLIGTQGTTLYSTTFSSTVSANVASGTGTWAAALRPLAYLQHSGTSFVATLDTNSSTVSLFNLTDPANPVLVSTGNATTGTPNGNLNGAGQIAWGPYLGNDQYLLYALNTNNGIQGFTVNFAAVPEPSTWALFASGMAACSGIVVRRRRKAGA